MLAGHCILRGHLHQMELALDSILCRLCGEEVRTTNHIFILVRRLSETPDQRIELDVRCNAGASLNMLFR